MEGEFVLFSLHLSFTPPPSLSQVVMVSMTEVLAQAVYNLKLDELPLDHLALGFQRPRTVSMGRNNVSSHREIAPPRLSSFSALFDAPPTSTFRTRGHTPSRKASSNKELEGSHRQGAGSSSGRGHLQRWATQEEHGNPPLFPTPPNPRHSLPGTTLSGAVHTSIPPNSLVTIAEATSPRQTTPSRDQEVSSPSTMGSESTLLTTPYRRLKDDDSSSGGEAEDRGGEKEGAESVIANLNARTPSPTASQEVERTDQRRKLTLPGSFLKHRSPESKLRKGRGSDTQLLSSPVEDSGKSRKKRKWFHTRSGSAEVSSSSVTVPQPAEEGGVATDDHTPSLSLEVPEPKVFVMHKSLSEGHIHGMLQSDRGSSPASLPSRSRGEDAIPAFCRVTSMTSPEGISESSHSTSPQPVPVEAPGVGVVATPTTTASHRPLRRSLTMDSPEPATTGMLLYSTMAVLYTL